MSARARPRASKGASGPAQRVPKGAERLARDIVRRIYEGQLKPGDKFLSEAEALAMYGVSRATLREALRHLQLQGVLRIRTGPGGGHFVSRPRPESLASAIALLLQFAGAPINDILDARRVIEPAIAGEAARRRSPEHVAALDAAVAAIAAAGEDRPFFAAYTAFWDAVTAASANALFRLLIPALVAIGRSGGFASTEDGRRRVLDACSLIRDAIAAGDAPGANRAVVGLHEMIAEFLTERFPERLPLTVSWADVQDIL